jgi:UDP-N-acetylglucosamine--N-acetylmuramyl-(pentapeptide) pyrophosphoryl-undecaprenol N-acetylglucosamine transferase
VRSDDGDFRLLVAAGGSGGHLYPALAVAGKVLEDEPDTKVIFSGTKRGLEARIVPNAGFALEMVRVEPLRGGSIFRKLKGIASLPFAFIDAMRLLRKVEPSVVFGVGGYVSGPLLAVAGTIGVPTLILEPNATPGLANRWLAPFVDRAALGWDVTKRYFGSKGFVSGNPVREAIARVPVRSPGREMNVLVFGGSQGSQVLNRAMVAALPLLASQKDRIRVTHQTGEAERDSVAAAYGGADFPARVEAYLEAMDREYAECDLVVSRAGATTCAELAAAGRPSVLVPLPLAGGHQADNAEMLAREGAARVILQEALTGETLADALLRLLDEPEQRRSMAEHARRLARLDAADIITGELFELAGRPRRLLG